MMYFLQSLGKYWEVVSEESDNRTSKLKQKSLF